MMVVMDVMMVMRSIGVYCTKIESDPTKSRIQSGKVKR